MKKPFQTKMPLTPTEIKNILAETRVLVGGQSELDYVSLNNSFAVPRLCNWFNYFNQKFSVNPSIYLETVLALVELAKQNELFRTQTQHELEQSLEFYEKIIYSPYLLRDYNPKIARTLLHIALIYGKYGSLQNKPFKVALDQLKPQLSVANLHLFFEQLFVKYESPKILIKHLHLLSLKETDILMFAIQGNNIRNYPDIEFKISNKEINALLFKIPINIRFKSHAFKKSIGAAKLISNIQGTKNLKDFLEGSMLFEYRIDDFILEIEFWKKVYLLLREALKLNNYYSVIEYIDFIEYKRQLHGKAYNLKGVTAASLLNAVRDWHLDNSFNPSEELFASTWHGTGKNDFTILDGNEKFVFTEIKNGEQLYKESMEMRHCVFSYIDFCISGECSIWSLKKTENTILKNYLTLEIQKNTIVQVRGKFNTYPSKDDDEKIAQWAEANKFKIDYEKKNLDAFQDEPMF